MSSTLDVEFFKGNRTALRKLFTGTAPIIITANGLMQRSADTAFPFRQDSNFFYLTGLADPDLVLVMDKDREYLILPERDDHLVTFDGKIEAGSLSRLSGLDEILDSKNGWSRLGSRLKKVRHAAVISAPPLFLTQNQLFTNPARALLISKIQDINPSLELLDLRQHMTRLRMIKQPIEIVQLKQAVDLTVSTLKKVMKKPGDWASENQIEAEISKHFALADAKHGYSPIIAGGVNACTLHYIKNSSPLTPKKLLLIDAGAELENYSADITRTYAMEEPTKRQRQVYQAVLEVKELATSLLKPGITLKEYEKLVHDFMGEKLRELGLIKTIERENIHKYYPHGTSHFLGLDVHDVGDYSSPLETGMVLTVEPGIYIPEESLGIRVEDDILITSNGVDVLSDRLGTDLW